jgi:hypothetical protein
MVAGAIHSSHLAVALLRAGRSFATIPAFGIRFPANNIFRYASDRGDIFAARSSPC